MDSPLPFSGGDVIRKLLLLAMLLLAGVSVACYQSPDPMAGAMSFGRRQVDQMLDDRPDMRGVLAENDPVFQWVVEGFKGDRHGQRIYWNANAPQVGHGAEHGPPYEGYAAYISLTGGAEMTPIDKWASIVFELFNLENHRDFARLGERGLQGELTADDYAKECVRLEFLALRKAEEFFRRHPLPRSRHGNDVFYDWVLSEHREFEDVFRESRQIKTTDDHDNYEYFKRYFETSIRPLIPVNESAKTAGDGAPP